MRRITIACVSVLAFLALACAYVEAASVKRPPPQGAPAGAPSEFTVFTAQELTRGFLALAFGSDLRLGSKLARIHRFDEPVRIHVVASGSVDRTESYRRIVDEFARNFPTLRIEAASDAYSANFVVRLIDEKNFEMALRAAFGEQTAREFVTRTDPQCMTAVKSAAEGGIIRVDSFIIVDRGDGVFFDCAYHEMLHALGLPNHDQRNPWTTLNQDRQVGYLTAYDRTLLRILYDPKIRSGMTRTQAGRAAAEVAKSLAGRD